jgi:hypothetical protein
MIMLIGFIVLQYYTSQNSPRGVEESIQA